MVRKGGSSSIRQGREGVTAALFQGNVGPKSLWRPLGNKTDSLTSLCHQGDMGAWGPMMPGIYGHLIRWPSGSPSRRMGACTKMGA